MIKRLGLKRLKARWGPSISLPLSLRVSGGHTMGERQRTEWRRKDDWLIKIIFASGTVNRFRHCSARTRCTFKPEVASCKEREDGMGHMERMRKREQGVRQDGLGRTGKYQHRSGLDRLVTKTKREKSHTVKLTIHRYFTGNGELGWSSQGEVGVFLFLLLSLR